MAARKIKVKMDRSCFGKIAANKYRVEKETMIVDRLKLGESFRLIRSETGVSMQAIQR